jgi:hypothetical protein
VPASVSTLRPQGRSDGASHSNQLSAQDHHASPASLYAVAARTGQEAAYKRSRIAELASAQESESNTSAASSQASDGNDDAGQTTVRATPLDRAKPRKGNIMTDSSDTTTDQPRSEKLSQLTEDIIMILYMKRTNEESEVVGALNLEGVTMTRGLFTAVQDCIVELMAAHEAVVRVDVKRLSASSTAEELMVGFIMTPKASQNGMDQGWELLLDDLRDRSVETGVRVKLKLEATVSIGKAAEEKSR